MPDTSLINATFGPLVIRELISAGGIAEVYRAQHLGDKRVAAIKVMRSGMQADRRHRQAFLQEFELLQALHHPGLPSVHDQGEIKGRTCFVMDYLAGDPLHLVRKNHPHLNWPGLLVDLVGIVAYLHEQGIVHADVKLENAIYHSGGRLGLVDFGNARRYQGQGVLARWFGRKAQPTFGTPTYLAPELLRGAEPTFASDVYALGVCAFILLSGEPPFEATQRYSRLQANLSSPPPFIRTRCPDLPVVAAKTIDACLAKNPASRPADAQQVLVGLKELAATPKPRTRRAKK
jgi:serine/threonine protein kinase